MESELRVLVVGSVACGPKVASRLRRLDPGAGITVLERGQDISYGACGMPYFISGAVPRIESLSETPIGVVRDVGFFKAVKGFDVLCRREAVAIDRTQKTVKVRDTDSGEESTFPYDKLVLATGGRAVRPPIAGIDGEDVQPFRHARPSR
jgi:NADPH-dependent 2,4-dienoyl-CoA reductase/sulfur reductase-like enzyme